MELTRSKRPFLYAACTAGQRYRAMMRGLRWIISSSEYTDNWLWHNTLDALEFHRKARP